MNIPIFASLRSPARISPAAIFFQATLFPSSRLCVFCAPPFGNTAAIAALMRAKADQRPLNLLLPSPVLERVTPPFEQPA
jgi:hypothetical protein